MRVQVLKRTQRLPISLEEAWRFFSDPANLKVITPATYWFQCEPVTLPIYAGQIMVHRVRVLPMLRVTWVTEITQVEEPRLFVDQQLIGPYRLWNHRHVFTPCEGGLEVLDEVHYVLPFGPARWFMSGMIRRQLEALFDFRRDVLQKRFGVLAETHP